MRRPLALCALVLVALAWAAGCDEEDQQRQQQQKQERRQLADQARRAQEEAERAQKHAVTRTAESSRPVRKRPDRTRRRR